MHQRRNPIKIRKVFKGITHHTEGEIILHLARDSLQTQPTIQQQRIQISWSMVVIFPESNNSSYES